jgi:anthranilate phosphoribosyltransferase
VPATDDDLAPGDADRSAEMALAVLDRSAPESAIDLVVVNAALRIKLAGRAPDMPAAITAARAALASGEAARKLKAWQLVR